jgi:hypothetical protein
LQAQIVFTVDRKGTDYPAHWYVIRDPV